MLSKLRPKGHLAAVPLMLQAVLQAIGEDFGLGTGLMLGLRSSPESGSGGGRVVRGCCGLRLLEPRPDGLHVPLQHAAAVPDVRPHQQERRTDDACGSTLAQRLFTLWE